MLFHYPGPYPFHKGVNTRSENKCGSGHGGGSQAGDAEPAGCRTDAPQVLIWFTSQITLERASASRTGPLSLRSHIPACFAEAGKIVTLAVYQPFSVHFPALMTVMPRSFTLHSKDRILPSFQASTTMVSPGMTGAEKRTSKPVILVAS